MLKRVLISGLTSASLILGISVEAFAQSGAFPSRPVRIVVPFAAGGGTDVLARVVAQKMQEDLGQPFIVENRAGAGGNIGAEFVAKSAPDGHTLLLAQNGLTTIPYLLKSAPFDPIKDFAPIGISASLPVVLTVANILPVKSVPELIAYAKANPGKISYASSGVGSPQHFLAELFLSMTGTKMVHVPYKGAVASATAMMSGEVQFTLSTLSTSLPMIKAGKIRAIGFGGRNRHPAMTDLPTVYEAVPGYEAFFWYGFVAPAGTPEAALKRLSDEHLAILKLPDVRERLSAFEIVAAPAEEMRKIMLADFERWGKVAKFAGIVPE